VNVLHQSQVEPSQFLLLHRQGQGGQGGGGGGLSLQHCQVADVQGEVGGGAGLWKDVLQAGGEVWREAESRSQQSDGVKRGEGGRVAA